MSKKRNNQFAIKAARSALEKIAGQSLYQKAEEVSDEKKMLTSKLGEVSHEHKELMDKLGQVLTIGAKLTAPAPTPEKAKEKKPEEAKKTEAEVREIAEKVADLVPTPVPKRESEPLEQEWIDWQATAKVMQSVALIALSMIEDIE